MGNSMVSIALPSLMDHFSVSLTSVVWSLTLYTLSFSVLMPVFGVLGPVIGYKRLYIAGILLVCLGSLLCVWAPSFGVFLFARVLIGIGVAPILPTIMGLISNRFAPEIQGQATGYWAFVNSGGHAIGPILGGVLLEYLGWQAIFLINLPLGLLSILLVLKLVPHDERLLRIPFDVLGALAATSASFCLMLAITQSAKLGVLAPLSVALWGGLVSSLVFLAWFERRQEHPFVDPTLFTNRAYLATVVPISLQAFCQFGLLVSLPIFLIDIHGMEKQFAGLIIMTMTLTMALLSPLAGRLSDQWGSKWICMTGTVLVALGALALFGLRLFDLSGWGWGVLLSSLFIFGLGFGSVQATATVSVLKTVPKEKTGVATGFFHMIRFISASLGSTIFGIILENSSGGMTAGFFQSLWVVFALVLFTLPFTFWLPSRQRVASE